MLLEIDAIARAVINPHLADALADGFHIAGISIFKALNAPENFGSGHHVSEACQERAEFIGAPDFQHGPEAYPMGYILSSCTTVFDSNVKLVTGLWRYMQLRMG